MLTLELSDVSKRYKRDSWVVNHVSTTLRSGIFTLIGPNGAGKTTLLRLLAGILQPSFGSVMLNGQGIHQDYNQYKQRLGYVPQEFGFYPTMTGREFLYYMARLKGISPSLYPARVEEVAQCVGIASLLARKIGGWSAGLKQRLGIAQALLNDPDILLLDEPMVGLDLEEKIFFWNYFSCLARERIILLSSNIVTDFITYADRVLLLVAGEVRFEGSIQALIDRVEGKVWVADIPVAMGQEFTESWSVSSLLYSEDNRCQIRIVSDTCPDILGAQLVEPKIEDAYTYVVRQNDLVKKE
jgi:ABC-2 type transport system ATP-binding protein